MKRVFAGFLILTAAVAALWKAAPALEKREEERGGENAALLRRAAGPEPMVNRLRRVDLRIS